MSEKATALSSDDIAKALEDLDGWSLANGKLHKDFRFADFVEAFGFMARAALLAERADHHPEWSNVYRDVTVDLMTHEADGITKLDVELAGAMNALTAD